MSPTGDELAGVVDLFGALTRGELRSACEELAFRAGEDVDEAELDRAIDRAVEDYRLVACDAEAAVGDPDLEELLVAGPTAFPEVPDEGQDLPLIVDVERRDPDREAVARAVQRRFRAETARVVDDGEEARARTLLDVSYDVETWGGVDLGDVRNRLDDALAPETEGEP